MITPGAPSVALRTRQGSERLQACLGSGGGAAPPIQITLRTNVPGDFANVSIHDQSWFAIVVFCPRLLVFCDGIGVTHAFLSVLGLARRTGSIREC
jgi:hypothetical protein